MYAFSFGLLGRMTDEWLSFRPYARANIVLLIEAAG